MAEEKEEKEEEIVVEKAEPSEEKKGASDKIEDLYKLASSNTRDTIAYIAIIVGILMLFFQPMYGGAIIGIIAGLYFSNEIIKPFKSLEDFIEGQGMVRSLILGGTLLGLFIEAPAIFIGAAIAVGLKQIIFPESDKKS